MFRRKKKKQRVPGLNMTATADISFMLLIFFLVASSMDTDKGLSRQLPPPRDSQMEQDMQVKQRNVLEITLDANDKLSIGGETIENAAELTNRIAEFVANANNDPSLPEKSRRDVHLLGVTEVSDRHILSLQVDRDATYDAYFQMQDAIVRAYARLRNQLAHQRFGRTYVQCTKEEREAIGMVYPQRISENVGD